MSSYRADCHQCTTNDNTVVVQTTTNPFAMVAHYLPYCLALMEKEMKCNTEKNQS